MEEDDSKDRVDRKASEKADYHTITVLFCMITVSFLEVAGFTIVYLPLRIYSRMTPALNFCLFI